MDGRSQRNQSARPAPAHRFWSNRSQLHLIKAVISRPKPMLYSTVLMYLWCLIWDVYQCTIWVMWSITQNLSPKSRHGGILYDFGPIRRKWLQTLYSNVKFKKERKILAQCKSHLRTFTTFTTNFGAKKEGEMILTTHVNFQLAPQSDYNYNYNNDQMPLCWIEMQFIVGKKSTKVLKSSKLAS